MRHKSFHLLRSPRDARSARPAVPRVRRPNTDSRISQNGRATPVATPADRHETVFVTPRLDPGGGLLRFTSEIKVVVQSKIARPHCSPDSRIRPAVGNFSRLWGRLAVSESRMREKYRGFAAPVVAEAVTNVNDIGAECSPGCPDCLVSRRKGTMLRETYGRVAISPGSYLAMLGTPVERDAGTPCEEPGSRCQRYWIT